MVTWPLLVTVVLIVALRYYLFMTR